MLIALWVICALNVVASLLVARDAKPDTIRLLRIENTLWFLAAVFYGAVT